MVRAVLAIAIHAARGRRAAALAITTIPDAATAQLGLSPVSLVKRSLHPIIHALPHSHTHRRLPHVHPRRRAATAVFAAIPDAATATHHNAGGRFPRAMWLDRRGADRAFPRSRSTARGFPEEFRLGRLVCAKPRQVFHGNGARLPTRRDQRADAGIAALAQRAGWVEVVFVGGSFLQPIRHRDSRAQVLAIVKARRLVKVRVSRAQFSSGAIRRGCYGHAWHGEAGVVADGSGPVHPVAGRFRDAT